jgi:hypothetical protein
MKITELIILNEINMSPSALKKQVAAINALVGVEFEMYVPNTAETDPYDLDPEPDMDKNFRPYSIDDIVEFYDNPDGSGLDRSERIRLETRLHEMYESWLDDELNSEWKSDGYDYFMKNADESDLDEGETLDDAWEDQGRMYNDIREQFFDEWRVSAPEEREWIRDQGWTDMEDVNDYLGYTWPYIKYVDNTNHWELADVAEDFGNKVGREVNIHRSATKNGYGLDIDGSLDDPDDYTDGGLEFISPPLPVDELFEDMELVKQWAKSRGCYTNSTTGLHINVSIRDADWQRLDYVKLALLLGDQWVLEQFDRLGNGFCYSAVKNIENTVEINPDTALKMLNHMKGHMDRLASRIIHELATDKYTSINLKINSLPENRRVEFRSPGGDWLGENWDKIKNMVMRFIVALDAALDPDKNRKEYQTKLYKLLSKTKNKYDSLRIFSNFSAGDLTVQELKTWINLMKPHAVDRPQLPAKPQTPRQQTAQTISIPDASATASQINRYLQNTYTVINSSGSVSEKAQLVGELVNFMADRYQTPIWNSVKNSVEQSIQQSGLDDDKIDDALDRLRSGNTMAGLHPRFRMRQMPLTF